MKNRSFQNMSRRKRRHHFTLVEILAAMTVLVIIMLVMFQFFSSAQRIWSLSNRNAEVYENARIAMDVITRDLQSAVAKADDLAWYVDEETDIRFQRAAADSLRFVSAVADAESSRPRLAEIAYRNSGSAGDYAFQRAIRYGSEPTWKIYGTRSALGGAGAEYQNIVEGVRVQSFVCMKADGTPWTDETELPAAVVVNLKLMDSQSLTRWELMTDPADKDRIENESARIFTKIIYLGGRK